MKRIGDKNSNTALPFDQPGEFYHRRALKFAEKDEYDRAVFNIQKALLKDNNNIEYMLDFAGMLTEIEHFDDSNDLLFSVLRSSGEHFAECYFGLGCNFYGLSDYQKASSSFNKYLNISPEGEYAQDAELMLESINYDVIAEKQEDALLGIEWKTALDKGDSKKAIDILKSLPDDDTEHSSLIKNNLAVAYLLEDKIEEAYKLCSEVLHLEPLNIHALCNMSMIKSRMDDKTSAKEFIMTALGQPEYDYSELLKISVALCDLEMHSWAADIFYELLEENPYDLHSRHFLALALFNSGEYKDALAHFKYIERFKPNDSINKWYLKSVTDKIAGKNDIENFPYVNQVISSCVYDRINRINELLKETKSDNPWDNPEFRELVLWAFDIKDDTLKSSMITLITKYAGKEAAPILKRQLCSRHVTDDIKHKILMSLKKLGEKEPYIALMENNIVEVNINTFEVNAVAHVDLQRQIVELILENMPDEYELGYFKYIINTWNIIVTNDELFDTITNPKLWAASLEFNYAEKNGIISSEQDICTRYSVDMHEMLSLNKQINKILEEYKNGHNVN